MTNRNTSININGQRYEASAASIGARSIDGLVRGRPAVQPGNKPPVLSKPVSRPRPDITRQKAPHAPAKQVKPSATLMRRAVQKPQSSPLKRNTKVHSSTLALAQKPTALEQKTSIQSINSARLDRAKQAVTSNRVSRFAPKPQLPVASVQPLGVTAAPVYQPSQPKLQQTNSSDVFANALAKATSHEQVAPKIKSQT